jgi:hypothetical protein
MFAFIEFRNIAGASHCLENLIDTLLVLEDDSRTAVEEIDVGGLDPRLRSQRFGDLADAGAARHTVDRHSGSNHGACRLLGNYFMGRGQAVLLARGLAQVGVGLLRNIGRYRGCVSVELCATSVAFLNMQNILLVGLVLSGGVGRTQSLKEGAHRLSTRGVLSSACYKRN